MPHAYGWLTVPQARLPRTQHKKSTKNSRGLAGTTIVGRRLRKFILATGLGGADLTVVSWLLEGQLTCNQHEDRHCRLATPHTTNAKGKFMR
jgi:hypothetical protein